VEGRTKPEKVKFRKRRNGPSRHAVGDAAQASAGSGTDTARSSDWLAERRSGSAADADKDKTSAGVVIDTGRVGDVHRGEARESKRGQR
jgi:hypothetical protein